MELWPRCRAGEVLKINAEPSNPRLFMRLFKGNRIARTLGKILALISSACGLHRLSESFDGCSELANHLIVLAPQNSGKVQINGAAADLHYLVALPTGKVMQAQSECLDVSGGKCIEHRVSINPKTLRIRSCLSSCFYLRQRPRRSQRPATSLGGLLCGGAWRLH